jgi:osmotically inducible protein OsmC
MPTRNASAVWEGGLQGGSGRFEGESGAINGSYSAGSRFGDAGGTNPEELLAAAEAACFSMALAVGLEKAGHAPTRVETKAACTVEKVGEGFAITTMKLNVRAVVPGIDDAKFQEIAAGTKVGCPVSKALAGVEITMDATLESAS